MKSIIIKCAFLSIILHITATQLLFSQAKNISVFSKRNKDRSVDFKYEKSLVGSYYLMIKFNYTSNTLPNNYKGTIKGRSGSLFTLKPQNANLNIDFSFSYNYLRGELNPKFSSDFVYLLPYGERKKTKVRELTNLSEEYFSTDKIDSWKAYQFISNEMDTAFSARKGLIINIINMYDADSSKSYSYKSKVNSILIEHKDGTMASYSGFKKDCVFVKLGQFVLPHEPLGIVENYGADGVNELRFLIYYLSNIKDFNKKVTKMSDKINRYSYITPVFLLKNEIRKLESGSENEGVISEEIILQELSRKEKKKYYSNINIVR